MRHILAIPVVVTVALAAGQSFADEKLKVVASFSILGDMTARIGGGKIDLTTLVGAGGDAHIFEPRPADAETVAKAQVMIVNGLGFEGWLDRLVEASGSKAKIAVATAGVETIKPGEDHDEDGHEEAGHAEGEAHADQGHDHGDLDPHAWQSVNNAIIYVANITQALCDADRANCENYKANSAAYTAELAALDAEIRSAIRALPEDRRTAITGHDAFGYFAHAYGVTFLAPEGVSTESEASAADVARLITQIKEDKASALFVESIADPRLIEQIGKDTGVKVGGTLYSDALSGANGPAPTYVDMMRYNARTLTETLAARS
ncbi:MAG: metal ABC transporter substrate-binding protein [Hyphomicrobiaceae bacterium]